MNKLSQSRFFRDPQNIIAVGVTVISLCALIVSLIQTSLLHEERELIREQARASVWPYLEFSLEQGQDLNDKNINHFVFTLTNNGVGPAIITDVKMSYNDVIVNSWWKLFDLQGIPDSIDRYISHRGFNSMVIQAGKTVEVLNLDINLPLANAFYQRLKGFYFEIYYESIYGEKWMFNGKTNDIEDFDGLPNEEQFY